MADLIDFAQYRRLAEPVRLPELEVENPLFIDWLTLRQVHDGGGLPVVTDGYLTATDADGVIEYQTARRDEIEGSFDSRMWVRCDGSLVEFHGNISRWDRPDNVFGYLKQHEIGNLCATDLGQVSDFARRRLKSMQRRPTLVTAFWKQAELAF